MQRRRPGGVMEQIWRQLNRRSRQRRRRRVRQHESLFTTFSQDCAGILHDFG